MAQDAKPPRVHTDALHNQAVLRHREEDMDEGDCRARHEKEPRRLHDMRHERHEHQSLLLLLLVLLLQLPMLP